MPPDSEHGREHVKSSRHKFAQKLNIHQRS